ncbi:hypothetical protein ABO01nite_08710 [Asaia bogorensis NBRC 16594]|uniref:Uncharacterized protein n=1 Tax=Asaia bogorensis NBRC 16594 TaxID=1231624 RepID=A0AAN4R580_9PROT|nr:hypothetical protein ABO01nite_08710 [Asaia bogorensis NBRC 16594]
MSSYGFVLPSQPGTEVLAVRLVELGRSSNEFPPRALHLTLLPGAGETERLAQVTGWDDRL